MTDASVRLRADPICGLTHAEVAEREAALRAQMDAAQAARAEAEAANRAKDQFLAMLGHELRNPLAPLQLVRLIDDLLDVARVSRGKIALQPRPTTIDHILRVVDKFLMQLEAQLAAKNVQLDVDEEARAWLAERGYDARMGARPMARVIQEQIKRPLAEELLFGKLAHGGRVGVGVDDDQLQFDIEARERSQSPELV